MLYALLHNNEIKVGPRDYHRIPFLEYMIEEKLVFSIDSVPVNYNGSDPIVLGDNLSIVAVTGEKPAYNYSTEQLEGPFYTITPTLITENYTIADRPIDIAKNILKSDLSANRYNEETKPIKVIIQEIEITVNTDRTLDRYVWDRIYSRMNEGDTRQFKFSNDLWINLTKSDVNLIANAVDNHIQSVFDWESGLVQQIDAATTKAELEAINIEYA